MFAGATLAGCWTDAKPAQTTPIEHKTVDATPAKPAPGTIRGIVRNAATGEPLPGISVITHDADHVLYATSNQQGEYAFANLAPGTYVIEVQQLGPGPQSAAVTLSADSGATANLDVVLPARDVGPCCKPYGAPPARRRIV